VPNFSSMHLMKWIFSLFQSGQVNKIPTHTNDNVKFIWKISRIYRMKSQLCWNWCQMKAWAHPLSSAPFLPPLSPRLSYCLYFHYFSVNTNICTYIKNGEAFSVWKTGSSPIFKQTLITSNLPSSLDLYGQDKFTYKTPKILYRK